MTIIIRKERYDQTLPFLWFENKASVRWNGALTWIETNDGRGFTPLPTGDEF